MSPCVTILCIILGAQICAAIALIYCMCKKLEADYWWGIHNTGAENLEEC